MADAELNSSIPHLATLSQGPLEKLEQHLLDHQVEIETWLRKQWQETPAPFYCSVDLRNAGFKLAPVDTNLFPGGFNNLQEELMPLAIQATTATLELKNPGCDQILLIPENHTRNIAYLENLSKIYEILNKAGFMTRIGTLRDDITEPLKIDLPSERHITLEPIIKKENRLTVDGFSPCIILLNNDLSEGIPEILQNLTQPILPPSKLGWDNRKKSGHFNYYNAVTAEFAKLIDIDPWFINPMFRVCDAVNFKTREGEACLIEQVSQLISDIQAKYDEYGIKDQPFVIVKADQGTYGMGIMTIQDPEQIVQLNRKERSRMATGKGKQTVSRVIIQEGVYTYETCGDQAVAEPVIYMIGHHVVGGFYRIHTSRSPQENLNAPGMHFESLGFDQSCNNPDQNLAPDDIPNRFYAYGVVARLALLAAARELKEIMQ